MNRLTHAACMRGRTQGRLRAVRIRATYTA